jgi:Phosphotransferase enzyme family
LALGPTRLPITTPAILARMEEVDEVLLGGVANAGAVRRRGNTVIRPASPQSALIHRYLQALHQSGFRGAPFPTLLTPETEEFEYIDGEVPIPPYPSWAQTDSAFTSVVRLLRQFHEASLKVSQPFLDAERNAEQNAERNGEWNDAFGPWKSRGTTICHFDVCLENVVFRNGSAVAFLDFDFAAPGDPLDDLASLVRMCAPLDYEERLKQLGWTEIDIARRLRLAVDAYGLEAPRYAEFVERLSDSIDRAERFVRIRVDRGESNFVAMWKSFGGDERFSKRREWFTQNRDLFEATIAAIPSDSTRHLIRNDAQPER